MIKFDKIYRIKEAKNQKAYKISEELKISPLIAKLLINRGFDTLEKCNDFLNTDLDNLFDPFLLKDMNKAVDKIIETINKGQKICIYGDYDADGITSTSILKLFFDNIGANSFYYIPNRLEEGYGLNNDAIDYIHSLDTSLVITVDCGITNFKEVDYLNEKGIDIIITDHHQCEDTIPNAFSVINPNREDCNYPFKQLAGVGVAFKLVQALSSKLNISLEIEKVLPIVTIGTIADVVPLVGENRIIVKNGLEIMKESDNIGLQALMEISGLKNKDIYSYHVGFVLGPRLNASGRLGLAKNGVELFLSKDYEKAMELAKDLDQENIKRQKIESEIFEDVEKKIAGEVKLEEDKVIVLASSNWHSGVIGIVASKVVEKYHRPTILFAIEGEEARGSARSISTFNIHAGLLKCSDLLIGFGGHKQAAGMLIDVKNIDGFRKRINEIAVDMLDEYDLIPEIKIDCEINSKDITIETGEELKSLEPFGVGNSSPQFIFRNGVVKNIIRMGKKKEHIKIILNKEEKDIETVGFNFGDYANILNIGDMVDLIVSLDINEYMNKRTPQLIIRGIVDENKKILYRNYYHSMRKYLKLKRTNKNIVLDLNQISTSISYPRLEYVMQSLKNNDNILILVFNYFNAKEILKLIQTEGRSILKRTNICFNGCENREKNCLVILPILEKIDIESYEKIILYDMSFDKYNFYEFLKNNDGKVEVLTLEKDANLNKKVLEYIVPTIDEMRLVYKAFFGIGEKNFKIDPGIFLDSINSNFKANITIGKLDLILEIFEECNFLKYITKHDFYYIKLLPKPNEKIDILEIAKVNYLYSLKELQ